MLNIYLKLEFSQAGFYDTLDSDMLRIYALCE